MTTDRYREICTAFRWRVPPEFNIAHAVCGRYARDAGRVALYWEDESGETATYTYGELQQQANRLSNALAAHGVRSGDKIAIMLPQRPETAVAHIACYQMGAVAVPLSFLFGPDALEYRLRNSAARVALVDPASLPNLIPIRDRLPQLEHVALWRGAGSLDRLERRVAAASAGLLVATRATDPALLIYTSGTTGP
jgi:acetyl-CoA synthetase